jgi:hypothetical protein
LKAEARVGLGGLVGVGGGEDASVMSSPNARRPFNVSRQRSPSRSSRSTKSRVLNSRRRLSRRATLISAARICHLLEKSLEQAAHIDFERAAIIADEPQRIVFNLDRVSGKEVNTV